ncbi:hypothetical protein D0Y56_10835 [Pseudomonas aeruginosa]|uniref:hypothetical protein n=1 Tax=Pseudomonas aeruginosa TaxID=287 RepID=UPI000EB73B9E|nr:hypothetical protein [Pseudomonas aeruginosa]AXS87429.1 hypothetical protein D0Y56_10835 [Pseudomonas aeruginosa]
MNDRTLLELAARAAGIKARWFKVNQWRQVGGNRMQTGQDDVFGTHHRKPWNPLTDDGDALRLAVKLRFEVQCYPGMASVIYDDGSPDGAYLQQNPEKGQSDEQATRRAIVRAAAKIGKSMGGGE